MSEKPFKPNISFLRKVADGKVYAFSGYSRKQGRTDHFKGGEATYEKHRNAGYVHPYAPYGVLRRSTVTLTTKGQEALAAAAKPEA